MKFDYEKKDDTQFLYGGQVYDYIIDVIGKCLHLSFVNLSSPLKFYFSCFTNALIQFFYSHHPPFLQYLPYSSLFYRFSPCVWYFARLFAVQVASFPSPVS